MLQGRGYVIPISGLSTGVADNADLVEFRAIADKPCWVTSIQGHYSDGDSAEVASFGLFRASAASAGAAVTPQPLNPNNPAAGFTASTSPTAVSLSPTTPYAVFGGNGASAYGWYPTVEESQLILAPSDIAVIRITTAPSQALSMDFSIYVTEL